MRTNKKAYHKGNVRENLVRAAEDLLQQEGLSALSLRRVAREVGVAPSAVYNHFENREALLASVAANGYREITNLELTAYSSGDEPAEVVRRLVLDYLQFAARNPELYRLMFSADMVAYRSNPELDEAGDSSFGLSVNWWYGDGTYDRSKFATQYPLALSIWAFLHGICTLIIDGLVTIDLEDRAAVNALGDSMISLYLAGAEQALPKKT
jgi:AcrR family transcriptional regulator